MMVDIFSSFDLGTNLVYKVYPVRVLLGTFLIFAWMSSYWAVPSPFNLILNKALSTLNASLKGPSFMLKGWNLMLSAIFILVGMLNLSGLVPYVFSHSCHLYFAFSLSIPLWFALFLSSITNSFSGYVTGLVPAGCPMLLNIAVLVMEFLSSLTRLVSLGLRLVASMTMGHVILNLAGYILVLAQASIGGIWVIPLVYGLFIFEVVVCVLQAWIFWFMLKTYSEEHS